MMNSFSGFSEEKEVKLKRDAEGLVVNREHHLKIPEDQRVLQVAPNVIKLEELEDYVFSRLKKMDEKWKNHSTRLDDLEKRLSAIESKSNEKQE